MSEPADRLRAALSDRYRVERELGQGGMATVFLAEDLKHDRKVALKVLKPELAAVLGADRFVVEIKTTAALQHPHILPLFDSGEADGFLYYVMPFIDGETLRAKLDRETQLGVDEAVKLTTEVADALHYAHTQGVIHRDIKPENILLQNGRPMVADFGIALAVSAAAGGRMTETGLSLGTPHYMSPEQATAEKEITARSDQYALASVLYEMLAGEPPHTGGSAQAIIMKIIAETPSLVTSLRKSVPPHVAAALARALEKVPADRFATTQAFAAALNDPSFTSTGRHGAAIRRESHSGARMTVLAAFAVCASTAAAWGWMRPAAVTPSARDGAGWRVALRLPDSTPLGDGIALSRDGATLVYDGNDQLWARTAEAIDPFPLPGSEGAGFSAISPDGTQIAFVHKPTRQIRVLPIAGGVPRTVGATRYDAPLSWYDETHLLVVSLAGTRVVPIDGGTDRPLTSVNADAGEQYHYGAVPLGEGGRVAFIIAMEGSDSARVAISGDDSTSHTPVLTGLRVSFAPPGHLIVTRADGTIVALPLDVRTGRVTGAANPLVGGLAVGFQLSTGTTAVADDGRLVYVASTGWFEPPTEVVAVDPRGVMTPIDSALTGQWAGFALEPGGTRIAFAEGTADGGDLYVRNLQDGSQVRLKTPGLYPVDPAFTADGGSLLFTALGRTPKVFRVRPRESMRLDELLTAPPESVVRNAVMASDAGPLYLQADGARGPRIVAVTLPGGVFDTLATAGADSAGYPRPSPDGRWLAYTSFVAGRPSIHVRSTDPTRSDDWTVSTTANVGVYARWAASGDALYYVEGDSMVVARVETSPSFRVLERRALLPVAGYGAHFDVREDGRLLMLRARPDRRPPTTLVMAEHWRALLPR